MLYSQVVLTPTETKKLLTKAVLNLDEVKRALYNGMLIVHPSSTTIFMLDELGFTLPPEAIWICGHISPKGLCISRGMIDAILEIPDYTAEKYPFEFIIRKGKLLPFEQSALGPALDEMTTDDLYIKGVNAIDPKGNAGILLAARSSGGSIGLFRSCTPTIPTTTMTSINAPTSTVRYRSRFSQMPSNAPAIPIQTPPLTATPSIPHQ